MAPSLPSCSSRPRRSCTSLHKTESQNANAIKQKKLEKPSRIVKAKDKVKRAVKLLVSKAKSKKITKLPITQKRQSPVDIKSETICHDPQHCNVEELKIEYTMGDCSTVICHSGGFRVDVDKNCTSTFKASHLPATYKLAQFHAHWSNDGSCGSEHLLDGKAMSAEVHFVYWNTNYESFQVAAEKEDGLAVIGVFVKEGAHSENYQSLFDSIKKASCGEQPVAMPKNFCLDQLLPPDNERHYATYMGSLTTPPYSESVIWTVLTHPVEVSKEQLNVLRQIVTSNYRECQDLCDRSIKASRLIRA